MDARLPEPLQAALGEVLQGQSRRGLAARAETISSQYRRAAPSSRAVRDAQDALAYAMSRMPATYAALARVLGSISDHLPGFEPHGLADLGAGPGTASWAALATFPRIDSVVQVDHGSEFLALSAELARSGPPALANAERIVADFAEPLPGGRTFDLVIAAYALTEIEEARVLAVARRLWAQCSGVLLIVEPGRPREWARLMALRADLLAQGARMVAPCPHQGPCPLQAPDWCHFSVRLPRSRDHMALKGARLPYEDEKFSYLVLARPGLEVRPARGRVIGPPIESKHGRELRVCAPEGVVASAFSKRDRERFRIAGRLQWGDAADLLEVGPGG